MYNVYTPVKIMDIVCKVCTLCVQGVHCRYRTYDVCTEYAFLWWNGKGWVQCVHCLYMGYTVGTERTMSVQHIHMCGGYVQ